MEIAQTEERIIGGEGEEEEKKNIRDRDVLVKFCMVKNTCN